MNYEFHKTITSGQTRYKTLKQTAMKTTHFPKAADKLSGVSYASCTA